MKSRRDFLKVSGLFVTGFICGSCNKSSNSLIKNKKIDEPPNIMLITADDLGIDVGCYGDKQANTPNIDKIANNGTRFETAWITQASCSPSRSSIHTGLYPHQNGLIGLSHRGYSFNKKYPTISSILKKEGYSTGVIGKFHVEPKGTCLWDLEYTNLQVCNRERNVIKMNDVADSFINKSDSPFFLMVNYIDPHRPFYDKRHGLPQKPLTASEVEPIDFLKLNSPSIREETAGYYNCISRLDSGIGMLLESLEKSGKRDNTVIIFLGDHGSPFTRSKTTCYDMGLRVPFIVSYPPQFKKGQVRKEMISSIDILPTILDIVNVDKPRNLPGRSFYSLAQGRAAQWRQYLYGEYNSHQQFSWYPRRTVRDERYHLIENLLPHRENPIRGIDGCSAWKASRDESLKGTEVYKAYDRYNKPPRYELFDLYKDPYEFKNLADDPKYLKTKERLIKMLNKWRDTTDDPLIDDEVLEAYTRRHDKAATLETRSMPEGYLEGLPGL
jgi:N-sulfoglucosamine sulfohydrolase